jgi:hypothetical protein
MLAYVMQKFWRPKFCPSLRVTEVACKRLKRTALFFRTDASQEVKYTAGDPSVIYAAYSTVVGWKQRLDEKPLFAAQFVTVHDDLPSTGLNHKPFATCINFMGTRPSVNRRPGPPSASAARANPPCDTIFSTPGMLDVFEFPDEPASRSSSSNSFIYLSHQF